MKAIVFSENFENMKFVNSKIDEVSNRIPDKRMDEVFRWCKENLSGEFMIGVTASWFEKEEDKLMFSLRFSELIGKPDW